MDKVEDVPLKSRKQEVKIGYETAWALGFENASPELQKYAADKVKSLIDARIKDNGATSEQVDALRQEIDKLFAAKCGQELKEKFKDVKDKSSFDKVWDPLNNKGTLLSNARNAALDEMKSKELGHLITNS